MTCVRLYSAQLNDQKVTSDSYKRGLIGAGHYRHCQQIRSFPLPVSVDLRTIAIEIGGNGTAHFSEQNSTK